MNKGRMIFVICLIALGGLAAAAFGVYVWYVNNVAQLKYASLVSDGDIELRHYPAFVVAEVTRKGDRRSTVNGGFRPLAAYIFAKERAGDKINMTAPVIQQRRETIAMTAPVTQMPTDSSGSWAVRFIMPTNFTLETLPKPVASGVRLASVPAQKRAVIRFSGVTTDELIAAKEATLRKWMGERGLRSFGPPTYAYYNHPLTPGFLRRNEVMFDVAND